MKNKKQIKKIFRLVKARQKWIINFNKGFSATTYSNLKPEVLTEEMMLRAIELIKRRSIINFAIRAKFMYGDLILDKRNFIFPTVA